MKVGGEIMMKFKKIASVILAVTLMATSLVACGSANDAPAPTTEETTTEETTTEEATTEEATTEEAGEEVAPATEGGETFKIGGIGPTTGPAAVYGQAVANGAQIAVDEINAAGGINGFQIELSFEDDEHDAEKAVNAYNTLKDWGMQMLLGTVTSGPCIAVVDKTAEDSIFHLTPSATAVEAIKHDNAFRVCFSDPTQGVVSADYIADEGIASKVAVIYDSSDAYSTGIYETFASQAATKGLEIVAAEAFTGESNSDFSVQLQKAQDAGAELVFLPFYYQEAALVLNQANTMGYAPIFFGCDGMDGILDVEGFEAGLADGVKFLSPFLSTATDDLTANFVSAFQAAYNEVPNQFAAGAYDGIYIMKEAIESVNVTPDMSAEEINEAVKSAMTEITLDGVTGKDLKWQADGEPQKEPMVLEIRDGAYNEL